MLQARPRRWSEQQGSQEEEPTPLQQQWKQGQDESHAKEKKKETW